MVVNGAVKWDDLAQLRDHLPDEITINHLDDRALLALQGPEAFDALVRHTTGEWDLGVLGFMQGGKFRIGGVDAWISRSGYTGEDGFEISIDASRAAEVAGLLCSEAEVKPIGLAARDSPPVGREEPAEPQEMDELAFRRRNERGSQRHAAMLHP